MNITMWRKALQVIPHVSKDEWRKLDVISKWLISTRAAVLIMTFLSGAFAGIFAFRDGNFNLVKWVLLTLGLIFSHATNNLLNDFTDFNRGVDKDNYYRAQYGPQPLVHGLMTKRQHLTYAGITGAIALVFGSDPGGHDPQLVDAAAARAGCLFRLVLHLAAKIYRPG